MLMKWYGSRHGERGDFFFDNNGNLYFEKQGSGKIILCKRGIRKLPPCAWCGKDLNHKEKDFCKKCDKEVDDLIKRVRSCQ